MSSDLRLRVVPHEGDPFEHRVQGSEVVIGRSSSADLTLPDRFLSRRHTRIFRDDDGRWMVEDLESHNGTILEGRRIDGPTPFRPGDVVVLSGVTITALGPAASAALAHGDETATGRRRSRADSAPPSRADSVSRKVLRDATVMLPQSDVAAPESQVELRKFANRLRLLNEVHEALSRSISLDELFEMILDRVFDALEPEQAWILLRSDDEGDDGLEAVASRTVGVEAAPEPLESRSLAREVMDQRMAALVVDAETDSRFAAAESLLVSGIKSLLAAPLLAGDVVHGMVVLSSRAHVRLFAEEDLELLVSLASVAALRIHNVRLAVEAAERRRLEDELALARRIQERLLPDDLPQVPGWSIYARNVPSRGVSGDYYTVVHGEAGADDLALMLADVSGKGMAASLLTASLEALAADPLEVGRPPEEICRRVARQLFRRTPPEKYATAIVARIDPATGRVRYTNAGHNQGLWIRGDGSIERLEPTGTPIGLLPAAEYEAGELDMAPGDVLVVYTDGFTEAADPDDEEFGLERLEEVCREHRELAPRELARVIDERVEAFVRGVPFADDRTLLILCRDGATPEGDA